MKKARRKLSNQLKVKPKSNRRKLLVICAVAGIVVLWLSSFFLTAYQSDKQMTREQEEYAQIKEFMYKRITVAFPDDTVHTFSEKDWICKFKLTRNGNTLPVLVPMFDEFCDEKHRTMIKEAYFEIFRENSKEELAGNKQL